MHRVEALEPGTAVAEVVTDPALGDPRASLRPRTKKRRGMGKPTPAKWLLGAVAVFVVTLLSLLGAAPHVDKAACAWLALLGFGLGAVLCLIALVSSLGAALRPAATGSALPNIGMALLSFVMMCFGVVVAFGTAMAFARGRQLRRFGRVLLPPLARSETWLGSALDVENVSHAPLGAGQQWRENGRTEHASVASFARLTLDLMALGAPPALIAAANQDALDEIRHAEACFALAHALDGKGESPAPFPAAQRARSVSRSRTLALAELAVTSLIDGALHEGVSARIIGKLARRCDNRQICDVLKGIAADEGRHAAHGWDVVEWCLAQGGNPVAHALAGAARTLPKRMRSTLPAAAQSGAWESWGIHGEALENTEYGRARAAVVQRVQALLEQTVHRGAAA